ncbi:hypothetical protein Lal_00019909 [Lupinus albus]|nr:hypothetical protein Lal_00019909 [Lupinus albus]
MTFFKLIYANSFTRLDYEYPHAHLFKFYELCGTMGASEDEEKRFNTYLRFPQWTVTTIQTVFDSTTSSSLMDKSYE